MQTETSSQPDHQKPSSVWRRSGTWMVFIMFAFGLSMIGLLFLYFELHTRPFRPLQEAIGARYPNSMPRVIGGKHKSHQPQSKTTLRIVIVVPFDPTEGLPRPAGTPPDETDRVTLTDDMIVNERVQQAHASLLHLAKGAIDLEPYEVIEIFLEHRRPEKSARTLFATRSKDDWFVRYPHDISAAAPPASTP